MAGTITAAVHDSGSAGVAPQFAANGTQIGTLCVAWVNFNGVTTATVRASFNVSSVTRNGTGDYTINFTNTLTDANYSALVHTDGANSNGNPPYQHATYPITSSSGFRFVVLTYNAGAFVDAAYACIAVFR